MEFHHLETGRQTSPSGRNIRQADLAQSDNFTIVQVLPEEDSAVMLKSFPPAGPEAMDNLAQVNRRLRTVYEISEIISSTFELAQLYKKILQAIFTTVNVERACILLLHPESGELISQASMDSGGREDAAPYSRTIVRSVIQNGESLLLSNAQNDVTFDSSKSIIVHNIRSAMCVPIRTREKIIGAINVDASGASLFSKNDLRLLTLIGAQAGIVIQNARLVEENIKAARLAAVGQTVASLAHCIKNILQGLKGGASMIDEGLRTEDQNLITAAWPLLKGSQQRISELVLNMLDYSKERKPVYERADLREPMNNIRDIMADRAQEKDVCIELEYSDQTPPIECDALGVYRATLNLVTNAIDAAEAGAAEDKRVLLRVGPDPDGLHLRISVSDNGAGIPPEVKEKLFEAFHSTKDSKGTGLGLAVTKKIIDEHRGEILIETELGTGTTFTLILPILKPQ